MRHLTLALAAAALGALAAPALADVIRVPQDHATIQAAVNAALPGDKILVRAGTYPENVVVNAKPNILIRGQGLVTVNPPGSNAISVLNSNGVRIKGISASTVGLSFGFFFSNSPNGLVAKCRAQGAVGFVAASSNGTRFVACKASTQLAGIGFGGSGTHSAERCAVASATSGRGFAVGGDTANLIRCRVTYTGVPTQSAILSTVSVRFFAERCRVQTVPAPGSVYGFELQPGGPAAQHELVRNRIEGCNAAIVSSSANNVRCTGNVLSGAQAGGIGLTGLNHVLDRNKILLSSGSGIGIVFLNVGSTTVRRNKIQSGGTGVIMINGTGNTITSNKFKNLNFGVSLTGNANTIGPDNRYKNVLTPINDSGVGTIILDSP